MKIITYLILFLILSSCANDIRLPGGYNLQLAPEKVATTKIINLKITYIIPKNLNSSVGIDGLIFKNSHWGQDPEKKITTKFENNILKVERRNEDAISASGRIYNIHIIKTHELNSKTIILHPESMNTYQKGILPLPLPNFDLKSYLTSASIDYDFELNSDFPAKSIKANFDRLLKSRISLSKALCSIDVRVYPYRNGSKISVKANIYNMKPIDDVINVSQSIIELEEYIKNIVNS